MTVRRAAAPATDGAAAVTAYLRAQPPAFRDALQRLRALIHDAVPGLAEGMSYGLPAFRLGGRPVVLIGARARHCALYPMSGTLVAAHADRLARFETSQGTIRFTPERPLSRTLVRTLVRARVRELGAPRGRGGAAARRGQARPGAPASPARVARGRGTGATAASRPAAPARRAPRR